MLGHQTRTPVGCCCLYICTKFTSRGNWLLLRTTVTTGTQFCIVYYCISTLKGFGLGGPELETKYQVLLHETLYECTDVTWCPYGLQQCLCEIRTLTRPSSPRFARFVLHLPLSLPRYYCSMYVFLSMPSLPLSFRRLLYLGSGRSLHLDRRVPRQGHRPFVMVWAPQIIGDEYIIRNMPSKIYVYQVRYALVLRGAIEE